MRLLLSTILVGLICSSCTHYYYAPNASNVPLFTEKGEAQVSAGIGTGDEFSGYDFQGAYSFHKNIGVIANTFFAKGGNKTQKNYGKGSLYEAGIGGFKPFYIGSHSTIVLESYVGYGKAKVFNEYSLGEFSELKFDRYFMQPAVGWKWNWNNIHLSVATSLRIIQLRHRKVMYSSDITRLGELRRFNYLKENPNHSFTEPAVSFEFGIKNIFIKHQFVYNTSTWNDYQGPRGENTNLNTSLIFKF